MSEEGEAALLGVVNDVLSEVIDLVAELKQARRKVSAADALHRELDALFADLLRWARELIEEDEAEGVSPLDRMASVAGRAPANLWSGTPSDDDVRSVVGHHLERLGAHVAAAGGQSGFAPVLAEMRSGLDAHLEALGRR